MTEELGYIWTALEKIGSVIVVSSISKSASLNRRRLEYISPNADIFGINAEALRQGYRVLDDYVHPDDREEFKEAIAMSLTDSKNFSCEIRNIGDDGVVRDVNVDIVHLNVKSDVRSEEKDDSRYVEFIIREIVRPAPAVNTYEEAVNSVDPEKEISADFLSNYRVDDLINSFASACELYSVVLDLNGKALVSPYGPSSYLGEFYEKVKDPKYHELYNDVISCIVDTDQAMFSEIDDGNDDSRFAAAPIYINGRFFATWILFAETKSQNQKLFKAFEHFSIMANVISELLGKLLEGSVISDEEESIKSELSFERYSKEILSNVLSVVASGDKSSMSDLEDRVGRLLDVDYIVYYAVDPERPGKMNLKAYWSKTGKSEEAKRSFSWDYDHYDVELQNTIKKEGLIIDKRNMTNQMRVEVFRGNVRAIMVFPIRINSEYHGRLIFIENSKERVWKKEEIAFAREVTDMISRDLTIEKRIGETGKNIEVLLELFDTLPVCICVRDFYDGKVIFVNDTMKQKIGRDITGEESFSMIPNIRDEYNVLGAMKDSVEIPEVAKYKRYIDKLDGIYDISEYCMKWRDGCLVSILVLNISVE